jgi:hypothetical protein
MEHELLVMLASAMTKEQIIDKIEESINEYREAMLIGNEEQIELKSHHLAMSCNLFTMHMITDGNMEGAMKTIQKIGKMKDRDKIFDISADKSN